MGQGLEMSLSRVTDGVGGGGKMEAQPFCQRWAHGHLSSRLQIHFHLGHLNSFEAGTEEFPHANPIRPLTGSAAHPSGFLSLFYDTEKVCHSDLFITAATVRLLEERGQTWW